MALLAPGVATGLALVLQPGRELGAVSIFLLAVVAASALGGIRAGLVSSVLGFLALNYFFTEPLHTFRVANSEDVVALVVFLVVALIVGALVARALDERRRATRRERESRLLGYVATKALSGDPLDVVLGDIAGSLLEFLRLSACEIHAQVGGREIEVRRDRRGNVPGVADEMTLEVAGTKIGSVVAIRPRALHRLGRDDRRLFEAAAKQISVVLERAQLDAQVADARLEVQTNQARAALFSSVTHDLRTPLASIKAGVTTLLQVDVDLDGTERLELLRTILEETDRLNRLVGNILDLARVRAGALVPAKEPTSLEEVVESVLHRMQPRLAGVRVRTMVREAPEIWADPVQIDQVVTNLVENAARYSPPGGEIVMSVAPWRSSVQVRVTDQGPGVPPEDRERAFEAFFRGSNDDRATDDGREGRGGSGLGLAIARAIVRAHGGRIWIEGAPSGGASVVFQLPVADVIPAPQEVPS